MQLEFPEIATILFKPNSVNFLLESCGAKIDTM